MSLIETVQLDFPWEGMDPFIFTVHHLDRYPAGNDQLGPDAPMTGRMLGSDFSYRDGWSMYHGSVVPGFPQHPHRGFETVTVVTQGFVDHSDSLGATARYGQGDAQWLTTGSGIMHSEMFPLLSPTEDNPLELFQIWLNLPPESKMVPAHFGMLWSEDIPTIEYEGASIDVIAGNLYGQQSPSAPPDSWASDPRSELAIWVIRLEPGATWILPATSRGLNQMLHCFRGDGRVDGEAVEKQTGARLASHEATTLNSGDDGFDLLLLQGRPIGAPVFQLGPFVMNSETELQQAVDDYRRTQFGGWPWQGPDPVHARTDGRFALHANGVVEHRDIPSPT